MAESLITLLYFCAELVIQKKKNNIVNAGLIKIVCNEQ